MILLIKSIERKVLYIIQEPSVKSYREGPSNFKKPKFLIGKNKLHHN